MLISSGNLVHAGALTLKRRGYQFLTLLLASGLAGCAVVGPGSEFNGDYADRQTERILDTTRQVKSLQKVDMLLTFDNTIIAPRLQKLVMNGLAPVPGWSVDDVNVTFLPGYVALELDGSFELTPGNPVRLSLTGELVPYFQPGNLMWQSYLHELTINGVSSAAMSGPEIKATDDGLILDDFQTILALFNRQLREAMSEDTGAGFEMSPMPLGILETGIRVRAPFELVTAQSSPLTGIVTVGGTAALVDTRQTRLALDLGFVATVPDCTGNVQIGRATFAREVRNREPVDIAAGRAPAVQGKMFFTDVLNTRDPTTIIHYWFADGQPASITELAVEPSARWRTWSSIPDGLEPVSHWQVLVVEKRSGCVLAHRSLQIEALMPASDGPTDTADRFTMLKDDFAARASAHDAALADTERALVSIDRRFFAAALTESMNDLRLLSATTINDNRPRPIAVNVGAVAPGTLSCNRQSCDTERVCTLNFDQCPVQRDTRDCSSCLLRNPLNNRCIREAEDPICLGARESENSRLENARQDCIARETRSRDACLAERERELINCSTRANLEVSSCAARIEEMATRFSAAEPLAKIEGESTLSGSMSFEFREFRLDSDLRRIRMTLSLNADLVVGGRLNFQPAPDMTTLSACMQATSDTFRAPVALPSWQGGLVAAVEVNHSSLLAEWSGLIHRLEASPSPAAPFFTRHEEALTSCDIGLNVSQALKNLTGPGQNLLLGIFDLDMQPAPTRITMLPAYLRTGVQTWTGNAVIGEQHITYRLKADAN